MAHYDLKSATEALDASTLALSRASEPLDRQATQRLSGMVAVLRGAETELDEEMQSPISTNDLEAIEGFVRSLVAFLSVNVIKTALQRAPIKGPALRGDGIKLLADLKTYRLMATHFEKSEDARSRRAHHTAVKEIKAHREESDSLKLKILNFIKRVRGQLAR